MSDDELDSYALLASIARSEGSNATYGKQRHYVPLFRHPLPVSNHRHLHENVLGRVLSCKIEHQGISAVTLGDAWTLEECYMRGGERVLMQKSGSWPIHMAVQVDSIDCVMILINIGVDINMPNNLGFTPLFLAQSLKREAIFKLLQENKAKMFEDAEMQPAETGLEVYPESRVPQPKSTKLNEHLGLPAHGNTY